MHAANLMAALNQKSESTIEFRGIGGDRMIEEGLDCLQHYSKANYMGFVEVIVHLRTILAFIKKVKADIESWKPDAVILVDYPGFNLRIAKFAKLLGIKVFYYISPQLWAWKSGRVKTIKEFVDRLFVILPFEKEFYEKKSVDVEFVGHPLLDEFERKKNAQASEIFSDAKPIIALLPGSRAMEIKKMLPLMLKTSTKFPDYQFIVAGAASQTTEFYNTFLANYPQVKLVMNQTYEILQQAKYALVTSGTATLETALFNVPEVVSYKGNPISYFIAKLLVGKKIKYISLVNLIVDDLIVTELIQNQLTINNLQSELQKLITDKTTQERISSGYAQLHKKLGEGGASTKTAELIFAQLS